MKKIIISGLVLGASLLSSTSGYCLIVPPGCRLVCVGRGCGVKTVVCPPKTTPPPAYIPAPSKPSCDSISALQGEAAADAAEAAGTCIPE